jgi:hypothetical protein
MRKTIIRTILSFFVTGLLMCLVPQTKAQKAQEKQPQQQTDNDGNPLNIPPGVKCLDYELNVMTLVANNTQMFWKESDCIIVHVRNNPFVFKYDLSFNEKLINEDDPLGAFGKILGVNVSGGSTAQTQAGQAGNALKELLVVKPNQQKPPATAKTEIGTLSQQVEATRQQADALQKGLTAITGEYAKFSATVPPALAELANLNTPLDDVESKAKTLRNNAAAELACLEAGRLDTTSTVVLGCPDSAQNVSASSGDPTFQQRLLDFARQAAPLYADLQNADGDNVAAVNELNKNLVNAAKTAASIACHYKAKDDYDFASIRSRLLTPLDSVLKNGVSFGYTIAANKREGPFGDPTGVIMTLQRDSVSPFSTADATSTTPANTTASYTCSDDPTDLLEEGATYTTFDDFFSDKPAEKPNTYTRNQNKPKLTTAAPSAPTSGQSDGQNAGPSTANNAAKPASTTTTETTVLQQPWFFGKPRLVVTGGLSTATLPKREFQRSTTIEGTGTSTTSYPVIGLKTNTQFRLTPMLYGHALLYSTRHNPDAWYATLGVTANSDNQGTDPEFLVGISRSFVQQRFFVTAGAYFGQKQALDGGLQVGQVIPSTLTGELPVTKSYHAGFAFGLSYRFASTKTPQSDTAGQTKQPNAAKKQ